MSRLHFSENQMKAVLLELNAGHTVREISRKYGISSKTLYRWRAKLIPEQSPDGERVRSLEAENRRLRQQFAELTLDYATLRAALVRDAMGDC